MEIQAEKKTRKTRKQMENKNTGLGVKTAPDEKKRSAAADRAKAYRERVKKERKREIADRELEIASDKLKIAELEAQVGHLEFKVHLLEEKLSRAQENNVVSRDTFLTEERIYEDRNAELVKALGILRSAVDLGSGGSKETILLEEMGVRLSNSGEERSSCSAGHSASEKTCNYCVNCDAKTGNEPVENAPKEIAQNEEALLQGCSGEESSDKVLAHAGSDAIIQDGDYLKAEREIAEKGNAPKPLTATDDDVNTIVVFLIMLIMGFFMIVDYAAK